MFSMGIGSLLFIACGTWFIVNPPLSEDGISSYPAFFYTLGAVSMLFFSIAIIGFYRKMFDKKPGLVVDSTGITDNSSLLSVGHIPWEEVKKIAGNKVSGQDFLLIEVEDPVKYIDLQKSTLKRKIAALNHKNYGSPIYIPASTLEWSFDKVRFTLLEHFRQYQSRQL